jgi:hypothetical protein
MEPLYQLLIEYDSRNLAGLVAGTYPIEVVVEVVAHYFSNLPKQPFSDSRYQEYATRMATAKREELIEAYQTAIQVSSANAHRKE